MTWKTNLFYENTHSACLSLTGWCNTTEIQPAVKFSFKLLFIQTPRKKASLPGNTLQEDRQRSALHYSALSYLLCWSSAWNIKATTAYHQRDSQNKWLPSFAKVELTTTSKPSYSWKVKARKWTPQWKIYRYILLIWSVFAFPAFCMCLPQNLFHAFHPTQYLCISWSTAPMHLSLLQLKHTAWMHIVIEHWMYVDMHI